jgi:hypothetical protein
MGHPPRRFELRSLYSLAGNVAGRASGLRNRGVGVTRRVTFTLGMSS